MPSILLSFLVMADSLSRVYSRHEQVGVRLVVVDIGESCEILGAAEHW